MQNPQNNENNNIPKIQRSTVQTIINKHTLYSPGNMKFGGVLVIARLERFRRVMGCDDL